jgi:hypothetical protein
MTEYRKIEGPSAWRSDSFASRAEYTNVIDAGALAELHAALSSPAIAGKNYAAITRDDFRLPKFEAFMQGVRREIYESNRRGFSIVSGIDGARYSVRDLEKIYWITGLYLGDPVSQSAAGDTLGYVEDRTPKGGLQTARGYTSSRKLGLHTDSCDVVGLMCVRQAREGGVSIISSVHSTFNDILEQDPDVLPLLFRGFHYHRRGEQQEGEAIITPYHVPVFHFHEGALFSHYVRGIVEVAYRDLRQPLTAQEVRALDVFDKHASSERNVLTFTLQPGEMLLANNYTTTHARSEFVDWEEKERKRLLLRLWLQSQPRWQLPKEFNSFENPSGRIGIDPKEGGAPAGADFTVFNYKEARASAGA